MAQICTTLTLSDAYRRHADGEAAMTRRHTPTAVPPAPQGVEFMRSRHRIATGRRGTDEEV